MIVVVEGPSAAGKTTWCRTHAPQWLPEPLRSDDVLGYQIDRWRTAVAAGPEVVFLDGDPFKLYYSWACWRIGRIDKPTWREEVRVARELFVGGDYGIADLILYADPGLDELYRRKAADTTRQRRNFEPHTQMRPYFREWYEAVADLDPRRVLWEHPTGGVSEDHLSVGPRPGRSDPDLFDHLLARLTVAE